MRSLGLPLFAVFVLFACSDSGSDDSPRGEGDGSGGSANGNSGGGGLGGADSGGGVATGGSGAGGTGGMSSGGSPIVNDFVFMGGAGGGRSVECSSDLDPCATAPLWLYFGRSMKPWEEDDELEVTVDGDKYVCGFPLGYDETANSPIDCRDDEGEETDVVAGTLLERVVLDVGLEWVVALSVQELAESADVVVRRAEGDPTEYHFEPTYEPVCFEGRAEPLVACAAITQE